MKNDTTTRFSLLQLLLSLSLYTTTGPVLVQSFGVAVVGNNNNQGGSSSTAFLEKTSSSISRSRTGFTNSRRYATVYAPAWENEQGAENNSGRGIFDDYDGKPSTSLSYHPGHAALAEKLSRDSVAALVRLAAVFNPTGRVDIRSIEHVHVLDVDDDHVDIEAVICESDGCVTLAIPVRFPHVCTVEQQQAQQEQEQQAQQGYDAHSIDSNSQWDACVMENLDELDVQATQVIRQLEWEEEHHEEIDAAKRERITFLQNSCNTQELHFPDWWTTSSQTGGSDDLTETCHTFRNILNEDDMVNDIRAIATKALSQYEYYDDYHVDQAAVAALCANGMIVRASTHKVSLFDDHDDDDSTSNNRTPEMVEIPIPFAQAASNADELQSHVMSSVLDAADYIDT